MAQVDETDLAHIKLGQSVAITVDAFADQPFTGRVEQIAFESRTVNSVIVYDIQIGIPHIPGFLRSGMSTDVRFKAGERHGVVLVPLRFLHGGEGAAGRVKPGPDTVLVAAPAGQPAAASGNAFLQWFDRLLSPEAAAEPQPRVEARPVVLGINDGKFAEVISGLSAGEAVFAPRPAAGAEADSSGDAAPAAPANPFLPAMREGHPATEVPAAEAVGSGSAPDGSSADADRGAPETSEQGGGAGAQP